jgi:hypothetical protein
MRGCRLGLVTHLGWPGPTSVRVCAGHKDLLKTAYRQPWGIATMCSVLGLWTLCGTRPGRAQSCNPQAVEMVAGLLPCFCPVAQDRQRPSNSGSSTSHGSLLEGVCDV